MSEMTSLKQAMYKNRLLLKTVMFSNAWLCLKKKKKSEEGAEEKSFNSFLADPSVSRETSLCFSPKISKLCIKCKANIYFNEELGVRC